MAGENTSGGEAQVRNTIPVLIGTMEHPLKVLRASTGFAGVKSGTTKGSIFVECLISQEAIDAFESVTEIAELIAKAKADIAANNAPLEAKLANPNMPEAAKEQIKKELQVYVDWKQQLLDKKEFTPVLDAEGKPQFIVKFKQTSIAKQIEAGSKNIYYIKHFMKDVATNKLKLLKDSAGNPYAKQTSSDSEIVVKVNTKIEKYPAEPKFTLTLTRLVEVYHLKEGAFTGSGAKAVNDMFGDMEFEEETVADDDSAKTSTAKAAPSDSEGDAYAGTSSGTTGAVAGGTPKDKENEYA